MVPDHPDALIGRTVALSNANRHDAAIETATHVIDRSRWFVGQALYWRPGTISSLATPMARADADRARGLLVTPALYLLSGLIDWRLHRLVTAERDFEETLRMDGGQCEAAMLLGGVRNEQSNKPGALEALQDAVRCYAGVVTHRRQAIVGLEAASDAPALYKTREIARHQRTIEQADGRRIEAEAAVELLRKESPSSMRPVSDRSDQMSLPPSEINEWLRFADERRP